MWGLYRTDGGKVEEEPGGDWPGGQLAFLGGRPTSLLVALRQSAGSPSTAWPRLGGFLANFGGLFGLVQGPIFNPKEAGIQVQYAVKQTKEIWSKTGLRFDQNEFSKFDS